MVQFSSKCFKWFFAALAVLSAFACFCFAGELIDPRDNHVYKTVKIGNKVWMAENLNYEQRESFCFEGSNCNQFGRYYRWKDALNICPAGWHLPVKGELDALLSAGPKALKNSNGFNLQQTGCFGGQDAIVYDADRSFLWSATSVDECGGDAAEMECFYAYVLRNSHFGVSVVEEYFDADVFYSVRCVKD
mgnify:CR=1 FL=1